MEDRSSGNILMLLDAKREKYGRNRGFPPEVQDDKVRGELFEAFATEQILKNYGYDEGKLRDGKIDGYMDGGIDSFFLILNGQIAEDIPREYWPTQSAVLDVYVIQCKHTASFQQDPVTRIASTLGAILDFEKLEEELEPLYNEKLLKKRAALWRILSVLSLDNLHFHLIYVCRGDEKDLEKKSIIRASAGEAEKICRKHLEFFATNVEVEFTFWGRRKLLERSRERFNDTRTLKTVSQMSDRNGGYVVLTRLKDYYDFIREQGELNRYLFESNVRGYLGLNPVNENIRETLEHGGDAGTDFWWLNNGITIVCSGASIKSGAFSIEHAQIVNGMQTSEEIFNFFSTHPEALETEDKRRVLIRILETGNPESRMEITYATNNQTNIFVSQLRAVDPILRNIEEHLHSHSDGIYFERQKNQYYGQDVSTDRILDMVSLAKSYVTLVYKDPYNAARIKHSTFGEDEKYRKMFPPGTDLEVWYNVAALTLKIRGFFENREDREIQNMLQNHHKTEKSYQIYQLVILQLTVSRLLETFAFEEQKLKNSDILDWFAREEVLESLRECPYIEHRWDSKKARNYYGEIFSEIGRERGIPGADAIEAIRRRFWTEEDMLRKNELKKSTVEAVFGNLPPQPWPEGIGETLAEKLNISVETVGRALDYLMFRGRVSFQVYGYLFNREGEISGPEGEHYGHSREEARKDKKAKWEQLDRIFGFS